MNTIDQLVKINLRPSNLFHHACVQEAQCDSRCFLNLVVAGKALVEECKDGVVACIYL